MIILFDLALAWLLFKLLGIKALQILGLTCMITFLRIVFVLDEVGKADNEIDI